MKDNILVSVIVPCYNCADTIDHCVNSIKEQSYRYIEVVLVDDGSTDNTPCLCDGFAASDDRFVVIHQNNTGLVSAWKSGVRVASGKYIAFCDSDDYIDDDMIEKAVEAAERNDVDIVTFGIKAEYDDGSYLLMRNLLDDGLYEGESFDSIKKTLLFSGKMQSQKVLNNRVSKLFKKEVLDSILEDIYDGLTNGEDAVTSYAMIMNSKKMFNISGYYPYHYVRNNQSMVGKLDNEWFMKMVLLRQELKNLSKKYDVRHDEQIENYFFSYVLMYAKKEITRGVDRRNVIISRILDVRNSDVTEQSLNYVDISGYSMATKLFASLFVKKRIALLYYITKSVSLLGFGKQ